MTMRTVLIVGLSLVFGVSAAALAIYAGDRRPPAAEPETVPVVVATADIGRGTTLTPELVGIKMMVKESVPSGAKQRIEDVVDKVVDAPLEKEDVIREGKLAKGPGAGLAPLIPEGMRAVTITTPNVATGVAGFIRPKNRVDVLLTTPQFHPEDKRGGGTVTLLQNVEIMAVDSRLEAAPSAADGKVVEQRDLRSVTLLVTLEQAALLDLAQQKGTLYLALRNPKDVETVATRVITPADLPFPPAPKEELKKEPEKVVPAARETVPPPPPAIPTYRNTYRGQDPAR
jgi:pilus assembly protein CpaB